MKPRIVQHPDAAGAAIPSRFTHHGGGLAAARAAYPDAPAPWIDLSTGINPSAYPIPPIDPAAWAALPDDGQALGLDAAAARAYGAAPECIVAAPGTGALIAALARLHGARRVGILGFTYGDHARAWRAAGAAIDVVERLDGLAGADAAVVVNPNNPDGRRLPPEALAALAGRVGLLVVDEAFGDVLPGGWSLAPAPPPGTVVLRSFGKFYGLAGLRLGFAVAAAPWAARLRDALGPWAVGGPALTIGTKALDDGPWAAATRVRLARDAARLDALLARHGAELLGGTDLFRLHAVPDAPCWFDGLARAGILTRPFAERPGWLRFGLPGDAAAWHRLEAALARLVPAGSQAGGVVTPAA